MVMTSSSKVSYEDSRQKRLEENKKRIEELKLTKLALDIRPPNTPNKPSPAKKPRVARKPMDLTAVRRSGRNAENPPCSYKEEPMEPLERAGRRGYSSGPRNLTSLAYVLPEDRAYAQEKAEYLQSKLEPEFPSFVKSMLHSHVVRGFWLGLPVYFCKAHLPKQDEYMNLVDEDGNVTTAKYLAEKRGLSAGWAGFALDHKIADGDACVFQLTKPTQFKIYILRYNQSKSNEEDSDESHLNSSAKRVRRSLEENL